MKDYLASETKRNMDAHRVFIRFLNRLYGKDTRVLVAHHIVCIPAGKTPIEIPSADTLWFDREPMKAVFGDDADVIMPTLLARDPDEREGAISFFLDALDMRDPDGVTTFPDKAEA